MTTNILFLCRFISIVKLQGLSISDPPLYALSERFMTLDYHIPVLSFHHLQHIDASTGCLDQLPHVLCVPHPPSSPQSAWSTLSNFQNLKHVNQVWVHSHAGWWRNQSSISVIIVRGLHWAWAACSKPCLTVVAEIRLVCFVLNLVLAFSINSDRWDNIMFIGHASMWVGV